MESFLGSKFAEANWNTLILNWRQIYLKCVCLGPKLWVSLFCWDEKSKWACLMFASRWRQSFPFLMQDAFQQMLHCCETKIQWQFICQDFFPFVTTFFIFCIGSKKWLYSIRFWMRHETLEMSLFDNVRYSFFEFSCFSNYNYDGMLTVLHIHRV